MVPTRATISALVIATDEEARLPACLASVAFCDEIVVVDGGSRDATVEIAECAGARVIHQPWLGFAAQRNVALDSARGEWVLEIDADERISQELAREIEGFLGDPPPHVDIGGLPIRHHYLGERLGPSAKYPDYRHRLFRREAYRHDPNRAVHEGIWPRGPVVAFSGDLDHELAGSVGEALGDAWSYARSESVQLEPPSAVHAYVVGILARPPAKLLYRLTAGGGWRDGWRGMLHVALASLSDALVWALALSRRRTVGGTASAGAHFSGAVTAERAGPARIVAVAHGPGPVERAAHWLEEAVAIGLDVVLIADAQPAPGAPRTRVVPGLGPFRLARAVDAEHQLRPIDALIPAGRSEWIRLCLVPPSLRGVDGFGLDTDPAVLAETVERSLRPRVQV